MLSLRLFKNIVITFNGKKSRNMNSLKVGFSNSFGVYSADLFRNQSLTIPYILNHIESHLRGNFGSLLKYISVSEFKKLCFKKSFFKNLILPDYKNIIVLKMKFKRQRSAWEIYNLSIYKVLWS